MKLVKKEKPKKFYICDPKKNKECSGKYSIDCGKKCFCTTNKEYSSDPDHEVTYEEYEQKRKAREIIFKETGELWKRKLT